MSYYIKVFKFLLIIVIAGGGVIFGINNQISVPVDLYPISNEVRIPAYIVMFVCFFLGALVASVIFALDNFRKSLTIKSLNKEVSKIKTSASPTITESEIEVK